MPVTTSVDQLLPHNPFHSADASPVATAPTSSDPLAPSTPVLTPVLSARWALSAGQFLLIAVLACWCWYLSFIPLFHAVTWRHLLVGQTIVAQGRLPQHDPTLPLADGMDWTTPSWLSDVALSLIERWGGALGLTSTLVVVAGGTSIVLACIYYRLSGRKRWTLAALLVTLAFSFTQVGVLRPELVGWLCFSFLLLLLQQARRSGGDSWLLAAALPLLLAFWANLDGTVIFGMLAIAAFAVGQLIDDALERGSLLFALCDPRLRRQLWVAELSLLATLLTPLGWHLWGQAWQFPTSPLWSSLGGARPLLLTSGVGLGCVALWLLTAVLLRVSRQRFRAGDLLLLGACSALVVLNVQLAPWFAIAALLVILPHVAQLAENRRWLAPRVPRVLPTEGEPARPLQFAFTLAAGLLIWTAFALSPLATPVLGGKARPLDRVFSPDTPHSVTRYLRENPPRGLVWAPEIWGDWLVWDGPRDLRVAANSNAAVLPRMVRNDYVQVARVEGNWTRTLDRYGVELLVIDKREQPRLADAALGQLDAWTTAFEDDRALIMRRREAGE